MPPLSLRLLGTFQVLRDGAPITRFRGDKVRALLAYLATETDRPHARAALAALLWPEHGDDLALRNLTQAVVRLRAVLGDEGMLLESSRDALGWRAAACVDVPEFEQLARSAEVADLARAAQLYGGEFLAGFSLPGCEAFEEWLLLRREQLHQLALSTLARLAELHERAGDYAALCQYARRLLALEPWHEAAHRQLMRGLALSGDRSTALNQYERCREVLANELGVEPDVETRALYERIRAEEFTPATRDASAPRHNLPAPLSPFVGREAELAELAMHRAQPETRLLTLIGVGGIGKTRLALELARASLDAYADGVFFVSLASLATASELPAAIAQALDLSLHSRDPVTALLHFLRSKQLLFILDNFEHLLESAELVVALLQEAPRLQIIVTSRARLNLRGEQIYVVPGLEYAAEAIPAAAAQSAAVRLFAQAARRARPGFEVSEANLPSLLRICQLVQGMPLGLELAAAWTEMLSVAEIVQEIERSADFLAADWSDAPSRQRSMRAVFQWSWRLLNDAERRVFRRLAVFRGGFTREAAETVVGATLGLLASLVHKSLLRRADGGATQAARYEIHELLRQFAAHALDAASDERAALEARHAEFYLGFVAEREMRLARNEPREAMLEIRAEIDNVRQAWDWAATCTRIEELNHSAHGLWHFYWLTGLLSEGEQAFGLAAEQIHRPPEGASHRVPAILAVQRLESKLRAAQANLMSQQGRYDQALLAAQQAITLGQASRGAEGESIGHLRYGQALFRKGQCEDARTHFERALERLHSYQSEYPDSEALRDAEWETYVWLGTVAKYQGDFATARTQIDRGLQICQCMGKLRGEMMCLANLAEIARASGDYPSARAGHEWALRIARTLGLRWGEGAIQLELGDVLRLQGQYALAHDLTDRALVLLREIGDTLFAGFALANLGRLHSYMGDYARARSWLDQLAHLSIEREAPEVEAVGLLALALLSYQTEADEQAHTYAAQAWRVARQMGGRSNEANALVIIGHAQAGLKRLAEATTAYHQALTLYEELGQAPLAAEAQAGLASLALAEGDLAAALAHVEVIWSILANHPRADLDEPFYVYLACYRVLDAVHDPRAAALLQTAQRLLHEYADTITDDLLRRSFLENVATHRAILEAAGTAHILPRQPS
jgi:predicted ATPase/DNA-binding SARP family transcriptional activator